MSGVEAALKVRGETNFPGPEKRVLVYVFFLPLLGARKVKKHRNQREFVGDLISLFFPEKQT